MLSPWMVGCKIRKPKGTFFEKEHCLFGLCVQES